MGILDSKPYVRTADAEAVEILTRAETLELLRLRLGQPDVVKNVTTSGAGSNLTIGWDDPTDIGSSAITGYYVGRVAGVDSNGTVVYESSLITSKSFVMPNMVPGNSYDLYVDAVNANGRGTRKFFTYSMPQASITPAGTPFLGPITFTESDASGSSSTTWPTAFDLINPTNGATYGVASNRAFINGANQNWAGSGRYFLKGSDSAWLNFELKIDVQCVRATAGTGVSQSFNFEFRHDTSVAAGDGDAQNCYKLVVQETSWRIIKRIGNTETTLYTGATFPENTMRTYVVRIKGSQISARSFEAGATDPAVWDYNAVDTARTNGVRPFIHYGNGNTTARPRVLFDNIVAAPV